MKIPKTFFIKDMDYDAQFVWVMLNHNDPSGNRNRARRMGINKELFNKIHGKDYKKVVTLIKLVVEERYKKEENKINNAIKEYQKEWNKINDVFYKKISEITNKEWKFNEYKVVVSPFHPGISSKGGNIIIRSAFENSEDQKRITAHEILMTHIWEILIQNYSEAKEDKSRKFWAINEVITNCILGLETELNNLWSDKTKGFDSYLINYPQIAELKQRGKELYLNKKNFSDFLNHLAMR